MPGTSHVFQKAVSPVIYELTPYDAAYLAAANNHALDLATTDDALAYAARDLGITVLAS